MPPQPVVLDKIEKYTFERATKVVLFADIVGSTRLIEAHEETTIRRWLEYMKDVEHSLLPKFGGRLVKRYGDGFLAEFYEVEDAVKAALECHAALDAINAHTPVQEKIELRAGLHAGLIYTGSDSDLYGHDVNVAARVMSLARGGETIATVNILDAANGILDVEFEDVGDCYLKNISHPIRVYRLAASNQSRRVAAIIPSEDLLPTLAIIPFMSHGDPQENGTLGEVLAEELIVSLSQSVSLNVTSRLSTRAFRDTNTPLTRIGEALNADFILSGTYREDGNRVHFALELAQSRDDLVVWAKEYGETTASIISGQFVIPDIASEVLNAITSSEVKRARANPAPTLKNYTLLLAAISLMHRPARHDFELAGELLSELIARAGDQPEMTAWLAQWHVLKVQQGWTDSPEREADIARRLTQRALEIDPFHVPALVAEGFLLTNLVHRLDDALQRYDTALDQSPSDALGRLLRGTLFAFSDRGKQAMRDTERALHLAPLDPRRYFFESLAASACISAGDNERALTLASQSLRKNRGHTSTLRVKAVAELRLDRGDDARKTTGELMRLQPDLTVSGWLKNAASADFQVGKDFAKSLAGLGVPE